MRPLRVAAALALIVLGVLAALLAGDVRGWQRTFASDDARPGARWDASPRVPGGLAERLLAVGDDVRARRAIRLFAQTVSASKRLDEALASTAARARAETALAAVARGGGPRGSQAGTLLGILAFGDLARGGGHDSSQAETAVGDFQSAVKADPDGVAAKLDLELMLRFLVAHGVRTGANGAGGVGGTGRRGAGGGVPGQGY